MSPNLITLPIASDDATIAIHHEIRISGHPGRPVFNSQVLSKSQTTYKISWTTESFAPIEEYRLLYRKLPVSECQHIIMALPLYQPTNLPTYHQAQSNVHFCNGNGETGTAKKDVVDRTAKSKQIKMGEENNNECIEIMHQTKSDHGYKF